MVDIREPLQLVREVFKRGKNMLFVFDENIEKYYNSKCCHQKSFFLIINKLLEENK